MKKAVLLVMVFINTMVYGQSSTCPPPSIVSVYGITLTSANILWTSAQPTDTLWDVFLIPGELPADYVLNPADGLHYVVDTPPPFTATGLSAGTIYNCFVRTRCTPEDYSISVGPRKFNTTICNNADKCTYKFLLTDNANNSWNGAKMLVRQNDITVFELTLASGGSATRNVGLCPGVPFDVYWENAGTAPEQIGISIQSPFDDEVFRALPGTITPGTILFSNTVSCTPPTCLKPVNLMATAITTDSAEISWVQSGAQTYDLIIVPSSSFRPSNFPASPPTISGIEGMTYNVNANSGYALEHATKYDVYIRANCGNGDYSAWSSLTPVSFTTKPINDEYPNAFTLLASGSQVCTPAPNGSTFGSTNSNIPLSGGTCNNNVRDVWYKFVATSTSHLIQVSVYPQSNISVGHGVFKDVDGTLVDLYCSSSTASMASGLIPGQTYYIRVTPMTTNGDTQFSICIGSPPANDNCDNASILPVSASATSTVTVAGNTFGATDSGLTISGSNCGTSDDDIWYKFTATSTTHAINFKDKVLKGNAQLLYSLFSGSCDILTLVYCSEAESRWVTDLTVGDTYYLRVYTAGTNFLTSASFSVNVTTPPPVLNDDCGYRTPLIVYTGEACTWYGQGSLAGATASTDPNACATGTSNDDVWFSFIASSPTVTLAFKNLSLPVSLQASVLSGPCGNQTEISCGAPFPNYKLLQNLVSGQEYFIRVWSTSQMNEAITFDVCLNASIQIQTQNLNLTPQQIAEVIVDNPCVSISNVSVSTGTNYGSVNGIGYFLNPGNVTFPLSSGLVLSTGAASSIVGPNVSTLSQGSTSWLGDSDLDALLLEQIGNSMNSKNATKLEFDFTTLTEYMSFNFIFASEEYGTFQCDFSDAFAFLLTDLVSGETKNLAVVPGTTDPVSVITIRDETYNTSCNSVNSDYFDGFYEQNAMYSGNPYVSGTNFNGHTKLMTASSEIIPNHPYHIKMVVADRNDPQYDSAIFIQAGSFAAGPPSCLDKIVLQSFIDSNANGVKDDGELPFTFGSFVYTQNDSSETANVMSPLGMYMIYDDNPANTYNFNFTVNPEWATYYTSVSAPYQNVSIATGSGTTYINFPVVLSTPYNDLSVTISPIGELRPGFEYENMIVYKNNGPIPASGTLTFVKDPLATLSSIPENAIPTSTGFSFNFTNLLPFESRWINVSMDIPSIPVVNIDDVISNSASIEAAIVEINPANNNFVLTQTVVGSYDPNDKLEAHGGRIKFDTFGQEDYLYYTIRFQNTGTANAITVVLEDYLNSQLDETSVRMINASHNYTLERVDNKLVWRFDYIHLPGAVQNEELSHGYVNFAVKVKPGYAVGDIIPNKAAIYFDTNPPIITNTFLTEFVQTLNTDQISSANLIVYPNPASEDVEISLNRTTDQLEQVVLYDIVGKAVKSISAINGNRCHINVADLSSGVYILNIITSGKFKETRKLIVK